MEMTESPKYLKPINVVDVLYEQTGNSTATDAMGMREMQAKAFKARSAQYLLLKAPPASGKSRALMFIALDKLVNQVSERLSWQFPNVRSVHHSNLQI